MKTRVGRTKTQDKKLLEQDIRNHFIYVPHWARYKKLSKSLRYVKKTYPTKRIVVISSIDG